MIFSDFVLFLHIMEAVKELSDIDMQNFFPVRFWRLVVQFLITFFLICFLGPHSRHMEVPRLRVKSELHLLAYTTATATPNLSRVCNLHHSSQQRQIL